MYEENVFTGYSQRGWSSVYSKSSCGLRVRVASISPVVMDLGASGVCLVPPGMKLPNHHLASATPSREWTHLYILLVIYSTCSRTTMSPVLGGVSKVSRDVRLASSQSLLPWWQSPFKRESRAAGDEKKKRLLKIRPPPAALSSGRRVHRRVVRT